MTNDLKNPSGWGGRLQRQMASKVAAGPGQASGKWRWKRGQVFASLAHYLQVVFASAHLQLRAANANRIEVHSEMAKT